MRGEGLYARLPVWAQHGAVTAYGVYWHWLRFGGSYRKDVEQFAQRDSFTAEDWRTWQAERVRELLTLAVVHVPYYRDAWSQSQQAAARAGRLDGVPLLEKNPLRASPDSFVRQDVKRHRLTFHTSGSTGTPIASIWTIEELRRSLALREVRSARWAGVSFGMARATFSGRMVEPDPESAGPFHRFNRVERQVYLSAFHLRPDTAAQYVAALEKHQVEWMTGYAVSYYLLARFILERNISVPPLKAVITTSEKLTAAMRQTMQDAYGCKVFEEYSTVDNVVFASDCEHGRLHVSPDAGIVEILRPNGTPCASGEAGEVVATCLLRTYQPLIRFRLGDLAAWDDAPCPCGRVLPVLREVVGRIEDVVVGPDGRQLVRFHGVFTDQPHVQEGQVIQEALDHILVKVVPSAGFASHDAEEITRRIRQRLGPEVRVTVDVVDSIPRTKAGKFQAVVSHLTRS
jgi:phenylacetate-CoA ligase